MAKRIVVWTKTADLQFVGVLEYWVNRNKSNTYSKKLLQQVSNRTKEISANPLLNKDTDHSGTKVSAMGNFNIYY